NVNNNTIRVEDGLYYNSAYTVISPKKGEDAEKTLEQINANALAEKLNAGLTKKNAYNAIALKERCSTYKIMKLTSESIDGETTKQKAYFGMTKLGVSLDQIKSN